ncbi:AzlD family protein [Ferrovibrio sp.]|uniref:AzlD family protein n=1 Tax=Ferrovibrio sp. TaxID=1917215 RepID=UPI0035AF9C7E
MPTEILGINTMALLAIAGMALATYITRAGGFWLMGYVTISPRIERFLRQTAGGVLIAIVTAAAMNGDWTMWCGLGATFAVMLLFRRPMTAILIGMAVAAGLRWLPPL